MLSSAALDGRGEEAADQLKVASSYVEGFSGRGAGLPQGVLRGVEAAFQGT